jgi:hypothetical protein
MQWWNKVRRLLLRLTGGSCGTSDKPVWCVPSGSRAPDLGGSFGPSMVFVGDLSGVDLWRLVYLCSASSGATSSKRRGRFFVELLCHPWLGAELGFEYRGAIDKTNWTTDKEK